MSAGPPTSRFQQRRARLAACALAALALAGFAHTASAQNAIVTENQKAGTPQSTWDISGAGDSTIQGFAADISVDKGETVHFKIKTPASAYTITIYRIGYYQGNGARQVGTGVITASLPQAQPNPLKDTASGLIDCGNWAESAHWDVPATAVSGLYIARLKRTSTGGASHIAFVVRDDSSHSDVLLQTSDATWQAYNAYGGNSLYVGTAPFPNGHAAKVSYNRPFITRNGGGGSGVAAQDWFMNAEYPMIRFLEANGYDITYTTDVDTDRRGSLILNHRVFVSSGHDEYWSGGARANVEAARDAGVHLAFFSGNEVYWKTRWENSIDASHTSNRTLVCYKEGTLGENVCGGKCDPLTNTWTGLWRDGCSFTPPADGCRPENTLTGQISWSNSEGPIVVGSAYKSLRFWRNTSVASLANGASVTMTAGTLGYEWDKQQYDAYYPSARILLSTTVQVGDTHHLSLYRAPSGALVFGAGTIQWAWGLDSHHDRGSAAPSAAMQQATVNVLADMGCQPGSLQSGLVATAASTDFTAPVTTIATPADGIHVQAGTPVTISGTSSDAGGVLAGVEVSVDGGATWTLASGTTTWSRAWTPLASGIVNVRARGFDDSGNAEAAGEPPAANSITVTVTPALAFPTTGVLDDFNRATLDTLWRDQTSGYSIGSGRLVPGSLAYYIEWAPTAFGPDQEVYATLAAVSSSGEQNLMLATQGTTWSAGHIEVSYDAAAATVTVSTLDAGIWTEAGVISNVTYSAGDRFGARATSGGAVQVFRNAQLLGAVSVAAWSHAGSGGYIGVSNDGSPATRWDDFGGGDVVSNHPPVAHAAATPTTGDAPLVVSFTSAGTTDPDGDSLAYHWDFGDGAVDSVANPVHSFASAGTYEVVLTADDGHGGTASDSLEITAAGVLGVAGPAAGALALSAAFPNPSRSGVALALTLPQDGTVAMSVLDLQGREVWSMRGARRPAGRSLLAWDGRDGRSPARPGIYFARVAAGGHLLVRRFVIVE